MKTQYLDLLERLKRDHGWSLDSVDTCVETGTWRGEGAETWAMVFKKVHTIEYSKELYDFCVERYPYLQNTNFIQGKSHEALAILMDSVPEDYFLFLDAHGSGGNTVSDEDLGRDGSPVLWELEAVKVKPPKFIVIDDLCHFDENGTYGDAIRDNKYPTRGEIIDKVKEVGNYDDPLVFDHLNYPQFFCFKRK